MCVLIDACVLYPTVLREIVLGVASRGGFVPFWSPRILEEWARAADRVDPGAQTIARGEIALLRSAFPQAQVTPSPDIEATLHLPDPADTHVLAAAITAGAAVILTFNLRDFPRRALDPHGLRAQHPDAFLMALWLDRPEIVVQAVSETRARTEQVSGRAQPLRPLLKRAKLPRLGKALQSDES